MNIHTILAGLICIVLSQTASAQSTRLNVTLDWLPSPEYYGFYYASAFGFYRNAGIDVRIQNSAGAPVAAAQLAAGTINVGTTTSDNLLRQAARGTTYVRAVPILLFNPVSIVSSPKKPVLQAADLLTVTVGTNPQSGTYPQYEHFLRKNNIRAGTIKEYPVGFGGAAQLKSGEVGAYLAYTTNQAVDTELAEPNFSEILLEESGIKSYGLVLAVTKLPPSTSEETIDKFIKATLQGYIEGAKDPDNAADVLVRVEPTLARPKVTAAIKKIARLNANASRSVPSNLDDWVVGSAPITPEVRNKLLQLFERGLRYWPAP